MQSFTVNHSAYFLRKPHIEHYAKSSDNKDMGIRGKVEELTPIDVNAIRKSNLRRLISEAGALTTFAEKVEINADYLSSIVSENGKRNPGDQLMRRVENAFKLHPGSLDFPEERSVAAAMAIQSLPEEAQQQVFDFIRYKIEGTDVLTARETASNYMKMLDGLKSDIERRRGRTQPKKDKPGK